jgi:hypothetical protein
MEVRLGGRGWGVVIPWRLPPSHLGYVALWEREVDYLMLDVGDG